MALKDWFPLIGAALSFFAALIGAGMGAFFSGRTERLKLLRAERLKACAELLAACRAAVRLWDMQSRLQAIRDNRLQAADPERARQGLDAKERQVVDEQSKAEGEAWNAYHRVRLLGPQELVDAARTYWQVYEKLVRSELKGTSLDFASLRAAEEQFYAAATAILTQ